jgi:hypothetical protein
MYKAQFIKIDNNILMMVLHTSILTSASGVDSALLT